MRAIILATGHSPGTASLNDLYPSPLFPLADRPFLQHVIEFCVTQGITHFDFVLSHLPEKIEHFCGDGKRWGSQFTFHLVRDPSRPCRLLKALHLEKEADGPLLLGHADRFPQFSLTQAQDRGSLPVLFFWNDESDSAPRRRWSGWALLGPEHVAAFPSDADADGMEACLTASMSDQRSWMEVPRPLSVTSWGEILAAHQRVLAKSVPGLLLGGREVDPGIWLSRNVQLHPTAQLIAPVFIGENCSIGAGVTLGPDAVIGKGCILDSHSRISNSVIFPGTYAGEGLEVTDVILDKNLLINVRHGSAIDIDLNGPIRALHRSQLRRWVVGLIGQSTALVVLLLTAPVLLLTMLGLKLFRRGPVVFWREAVRLPAPPEERRWRTYQLLSFDPDCGEPDSLEPGIACSFRGLLLRFLPGLLSVVKGDLAFVGVPARSPQEIRRLLPAWQVLYLQAKAGLVTEASVRDAESADETDLYAAEAFYVAAANWAYDLGLVLRFLALCCVARHPTCPRRALTP
jgi:lipopolysaccharide/colanic/teichoic acid biosynthesis glycosyltransferase